MMPNVDDARQSQETSIINGGNDCKRKGCCVKEGDIEPQMMTCRKEPKDIQWKKRSQVN